jgi:hypothetical protein
MSDLLEGDAVTDTLTIDVQDVPFPAAGLTAPAETADERETFTGLTREAVSDQDAERAFLAAKAPHNVPRPAGRRRGARRRC